MGAKQTKIEGCSLEEFLAQQSVSVETTNTEIQGEDFDLKDPRSPINLLRNFEMPPHSLLVPVTPVTVPAENPLGALRKRILKGLNLNDPRSPSQQLNRTPLIFDEKDKTLNLDDTFADLFVESNTPAVVNDDACLQNYSETENESNQQPMEMEDTKDISDKEENENVSSFLIEEETMACTSVLMTPQNNAIDPRSPSIGVDRTPIMFNDDDEAQEDAMLENILATLSLNLSSGSSFCSTTATPIKTVTTNKTLQKPANKHLERVKAGRRRTKNTKTTTKPQSNKLNQRHQRIYQDAENDVPSSVAISTTPQHKKTSTAGGQARTPLSCMKNRSHLRSRSVESSNKKCRLPLTSFDDQMNPQQSPKVASLRIMDAYFQDVMND